MATRSYLVRVPKQSDATQIYPDVEALQNELQELLARIDLAGESVIAVQALDAGWGTTFLNDQIVGGSFKTGSAYGAGYGFSYTHTLLVMTRTS